MLKDVTIVVVDDEKELRAIAREYLAEQGAVVLTAESGNTALKLLTKTPVDVVLSDVKMPDGDGVELIKKLKSCPRPPSVFLSVTGGSSYDSEYLRSLGADDVE